ncbi:hypothetical protein [Sneathiella sp.]|jgi:hypothetical protein|uniref:hypothetical protein n=1 Tax=Sneathiella sp. TaxID=1964365 RepID=UPI0039E26110
MKKLILGAFALSVLSTAALAETKISVPAISINTVDISSGGGYDRQDYATKVVDALGTPVSNANNFNNLQVNTGHSISQVAYIPLKMDASGSLFDFKDDEGSNLPEGFTITSVAYGNSGPVIDFNEAVNITSEYAPQTTEVHITFPNLFGRYQQN